MLEYWYIWYKIFENDVMIGKGRYPRSYRGRDGATKRAKQMWSTPQYNPLTNSTVKYMWVVSQEYPWEE